MVADGRSGAAADHVVLDAAGGGVGGAARWGEELDAYLLSATRSVTVIGRRQPLTPRWLVDRERTARRARIAVAANNVSFAFGGEYRRVLLRNALHFLHPSEAHLLARMPRSFRVQIPVVRGLLRRADTIIVPSSAMAERVRHGVPSAGQRIVVRPHPVTPIGPRAPAKDPFILVPVLPAPYKNLVPQLSSLLEAIDRAGRSIEVRATVSPADLPAELVHHPRLTILGTQSHRVLSGLWQCSAAVFFPSTLESFGYPLAEARVNGVPVLSPDSEQAREIAGGALLPYDPKDPDSLAAALDRVDNPVVAEPRAFDRTAYFSWLFELPTDQPTTRVEEHYGSSA